MLTRLLCSADQAAAIKKATEEGDFIFRLFILLFTTHCLIYLFAFSLYIRFVPMKYVYLIACNVYVYVCGCAAEKAAAAKKAKDEGWRFSSSHIFPL